MDNNILGRVDKLRQTVAELGRRKAVLDGKFQSSKDALQALVDEIKEKGYDPKRLKQALNDTTTVLADKLQVLEDDAREAGVSLTVLEGKVNAD